MPAGSRLILKKVFKLVFYPKPGDEMAAFMDVQRYRFPGVALVPVQTLKLQYLDRLPN